MDESRSRFLHALNVVLPAANAAMILSAWSRLPDRIPMHFGAGGQADGWGPKGPALMLDLLLPAGMTALLYLARRLMPWFRKHPGWINIPNRARFLALPPEEQALVFDLLGETYVAMAAALNVLFVSLSVCTLQVAAGRLDGLPAWVIWPGLALIATTAIAYTVRTFRLVNRLTR